MSEPAAEPPQFSQGRRSFLKSLLAAVAMAPVICRLAEGVSVVAPAKTVPEGMIWVKDPYPPRFMFKDGQWVREWPFSVVESSIGKKQIINPMWFHAPYEERLWMNPKTNESFQDLVIRKPEEMPTWNFPRRWNSFS